MEGSRTLWSLTKGKYLDRFPLLSGHFSLGLLGCKREDIVRAGKRLSKQCPADEHCVDIRLKLLLSMAFTFILRRYWL
jgi:hypothetical protein